MAIWLHISENDAPGWTFCALEVDAKRTGASGENTFWNVLLGGPPKYKPLSEHAE
jgi:hypothetical protein